MSRFLSGALSGLTPYTPGEQPQDQNYVKLNTNESPYPPSPGVLAALNEREGAALRLYSDPTARELKAALARRYGVEPDNVYVGNGSDEALNFAFLAYATDGRGAAFADITYGFYPVFCDLYHIPARIVPLRAEYDFILIDCPPSLGIITTNALCVADTLLVPIQCEYYALEGLSQLMNSVRRVKRQYNEQLDIEGVLLTMYDGRLNLTQQVVEEVKKYFPRKVFATVIPRTVRLSEAPSFGRPICYFDRSSKGAYAYDALADEVLKKAAP